MKSIIRLFAVTMIALGVSVLPGQAQTQTGTVQGKVMDQQGAILPGVTATLTGARGSQTAVTDERGEFRFVGIAPGPYVLKLELSGFLPQQQEDVIVGMGKTISSDFTLKVGGLTETVEVSGSASTVDVKSSATDTTISNDLLQLTPIYSSTSTGLLNYAPGINSDSAFGGQGGYGNALLLDGVDTRDPESGSAWTFFNQNLIEEIQVGGLGAPAEYGGFTGAIINTVTKSGGNAFSGLFAVRYTNDSLAGKNIDQKLLSQNSQLGESAITKKLTDYTVQMGGPLKKDKAFFFASIQRYSALVDPVGLVANNQDISPRFNIKLTLQPNSKDTFTIGTQYDNYNQTGRVGAWPASQATDRQTVNEDAPEWVWNAQWRRVFGTSALLETKYTGYTGYYNLDPVDPSPYTVDYETNTYSGGGGGLYYADRSRNQVQVALTKYAEKFGSHSFKFGAEIERSHVRSYGQPYGPAGFYTLNYYGDLYRYSYGYDLQGDNHRTSAYAQDQWSAGRLTLNLGLRLDHISGYSPVLKETVYKPDASWGPRIGAAYDLSASGNAVLKGFWGRYFEGTASAFYYQATPGISDYVKTTVLPNGQLGSPEVLTPGLVYGMSDNIKHPRTDEANVAFETQLTRAIRLTATGIWRNTSDFVNNVIENARFRPVTLNNALTGQPFTGYYWANSSASNDSFLIRNIDGFQYLATDGSVITTAKPERKYKALMLVMNSSMKNRFGYQVSYVLSKAEGNVNNTGFGAWLGGTAWNSPNTQINGYGELTNSRRHEIKVYTTYEVPKIGVVLGANYTGLSGTPYTPYGQYSNGDLNLPLSSRRQIFLEPRGTERNDFFHQFDLRAEKAFRIETNRFGVYVDAVNLFNRAGVISRQSRYPSSAGVNYQAPTGIQGARQITFGGRWSF